MRYKKISIYKSFAEQASAEAASIARQSPAERIRETVDLILRVYNTSREQLNNREKSNRINIIQYK